MKIVAGNVRVKKKKLKWKKWFWHFDEKVSTSPWLYRANRRPEDNTEEKQKQKIRIFLKKNFKVQSLKKFRESEVQRNWKYS